MTLDIPQYAWHMLPTMAKKSDEMLKEQKAFITQTLGNLIRSGVLKSDDVGEALYKAMKQMEDKGLKGKELVRFLYAQCEPLLARLNVNATCNRCSLAGCCHQRVTVTRPEALLIVEFVKAHKIKVDLSQVRRQTRVSTAKEWSKQDAIDKRCAFLGTDNKCKIYPVRPMMCRKYFVKDDPIKCGQGTGTDVRIMCSNEVEVLACLLLNLYKDKSLPQAFLDALEGR